MKVFATAGAFLALTSSVCLAQSYQPPSYAAKCAVISCSRCLCENAAGLARASSDPAPTIVQAASGSCSRASTGPCSA
jgi:hypothetical protein